MAVPETAPARALLACEKRLDVERIRSDFPILKSRVFGKPLVYLDNAATTQKPQAVIDALVRYYSTQNSNVHRGVHYLSQVATDAFEGARATVQKFINADDPAEIIFTRGTTEAINLISHSLGQRVEKGDEIIVSNLEHHSNIVPWQMLCEQKGAVLRVLPINDRGEVILDDFEDMLGSRTRLVAVAHVSNALGTINPVQRIINAAHAQGVPVLLDGAQGVQHQRVDVQQLDCDFFAFSGHKMYAPTGIGVLFGKRELLEALPPFQGGGDMILSVSFNGTIYNELPHKFEAGTPNVAGAVGMAAAIDYLQAVGLENIVAHEDDLLTYATERLAGVPDLTLIGTAAEKASVISFNLEGIHPHDVGTILDREGIAVRTGHHCAQPIMERFQVPATVRVSLAFYNTREEIDLAAAALNRARELFKR